MMIICTFTNQETIHVPKHCGNVRVYHIPVHCYTLANNENLTNHDNLHIDAIVALICWRLVELLPTKKLFTYRNIVEAY